MIYVTIVPQTDSIAEVSLNPRKKAQTSISKLASDLNILLSKDTLLDLNEAIFKTHLYSNACHAESPFISKEITIL